MRYQFACSTLGPSRCCGRGVVGSSTNLTMPFELVAGFLVVVDGQIGNLNGLKFILDTGATHSLIDQKVADRLQLPLAAESIS